MAIEKIRRNALIMDESLRNVYNYINAIRISELINRLSDGKCIACNSKLHALSSTNMMNALFSDVKPLK